jgi:hypothetical protein
MSGQRRIEYLQAIGIDLWVPRGAGGVPVAPVAPAGGVAAPLREVTAAQIAARWEALRSEVLRTNVYIANVLKSRPPGNRDPKPEEVAACLPYLVEQIALLQPKIMLAVGRIAAQNLLGTDVPLGRLRGRVHRFGELNTPLVVTYHPAYLLRTPADKRKAWEDLKFARIVYQQLTQGVATDGNRS